MKLYVGVTDNDWYRFLSRLPNLDEVNFWQPEGSTAQGKSKKVKVKKRNGHDLPAATHAAQAGATTLDRVHAAMLLQASGRTNALRALLKAEQERSPDFLRLAR